MDVRAARPRDGACRAGLAHVGPRASMAAEDQGGCGSPRSGHVAMALAVAVTIREAERGQDSALLTMLPVAIEGLLFVALAAIWPGSRKFAVAVASFASRWRCGARQPLASSTRSREYMTMISFSARDWESLRAPGTSRSPPSPSPPS